MSDPLLLLIETSTEVCSVALCKGVKTISHRVINEPKAHARIIAVMVEEVLTEVGTSLANCDAVVVSEGPGSYTGLRVGVSIAKGLCYGASKPLIAVSSLELLAQLAIHAYDDTGNNSLDEEEIHTVTDGETVSQSDVVSPEAIIIPMIDARRMEVYTAKFDSLCNPLSNTEAVILDENSFSDELSKGIVIFAGVGAEKFKSLINQSKDTNNLPNAQFIIIGADARGMVIPALKKYKSGDFVDVAYFEPFYLKDFVAGVTKKKLF